jgi:hypothetical protein
MPEFVRSSIARETRYALERYNGPGMHAGVKVSITVDASHAEALLRALHPGNQAHSPTPTQGGTNEQTDR